MEMELYRKSYGNDGEPVFGEEYTTEEIVAQLYASQEWSDFRAIFDMSIEDNNTLLGWVIDEKLGPDSELADYKNLLKTIISPARGVVRVKGQWCEFKTVPKPEQIVEPEVPTDRNGRPLTPAQIAWSEYRTFSESHSMVECKQRAKTDAGYGSFFRKQYERQSGEIGDAVDNLNQRQQVSTPPADELIVFAAEYHKTPTEKLRQLKRFDTNPFGAADWNRKFEACVSAGLI
jgi:hypothetical protein